MPDAKRVSYEQIEEAEQNVETLQNLFLEERGWLHTSETPIPCYWLWIKKIDGLRYTLPTHMALQIERCAEAAAEAAPDPG